mmetsp:Transcript_52895/g.158336  ORF Transcript_52895/g.158336 Transcript_52895/m.158336 type:complete len:350 (+) Transcript_52895:76-1125(+)
MDALLVGSANTSPAQCAIQSQPRPPIPPLSQSLDPELLPRNLLHNILQPLPQVCRHGIQDSFVRHIRPGVVLLHPLHDLIEQFRLDAHLPQNGPQSIQHRRGVGPPRLLGLVEIVDRLQLLRLPHLLPQIRPSQELLARGVLLHVRAHARHAAGYLLELLPVVRLLLGTARPELGRLVEHGRCGVIPALRIGTPAGEPIIAPKVSAGDRARLLGLNLLLGGLPLVVDLLQRPGRAVRDVHVPPVGYRFDGDRVGRERYEAVRLRCRCRGRRLLPDREMHLIRVEGVGRSELLVAVVRFDELSQELGGGPVLPRFGESDLQRLVKVGVVIVLVVEEDLHGSSVWRGVHRV